ncbi:hypothetical protein [Peromfec virus RodF8_66]|uniref:Uncharacterized protein n=1 Tax=Peromfec virus RodF8_66 TaxID=2929388 RepID=A0A976R779_9VIRU|nr:hypothetical protein [Peromfec virus RodF8_66]
MSRHKFSSIQNPVPHVGLDCLDMGVPYISDPSGYIPLIKQVHNLQDASALLEAQRRFEAFYDSDQYDPNVDSEDILLPAIRQTGFCQVDAQRYMDIMQAKFDLLRKHAEKNRHNQELLKINENNRLTNTSKPAATEGEQP